MRNHDESQPVSRMFVDLTVNTPTTPLAMSITTPSASYTQLRDRRRNLTTVVTDGDAIIDSIMHDEPLGIQNHVDTSWTPSVIYRYSPFMHNTHSLVNRPSHDVPDVQLNSRWYRDRYRSNFMYLSGHVCLTSREPMTRCTCPLFRGFRSNGGGHFYNMTERMLYERGMEDEYDPDNPYRLFLKTGSNWKVDMGVLRVLVMNMQLLNTKKLHVL